MLSTALRDAVAKRLEAVVPFPVNSRKRPYFRQSEDTPRVIVSVTAERHDRAPGADGWSGFYTVVAVYAKKTQGQQNNPEDVDDFRDGIRDAMLAFDMIPEQVDFNQLPRPPIDLTALSSYYDSFAVAVEYETREVD